MILVAAENRHHFQNWLDKRSLDRKMYRYVGSKKGMYGLTPDSLYILRNAEYNVHLNGIIHQAGVQGVIVEFEANNLPF